jgi:isopentenyl diphosphate isomerase/L-lactate dehydrogenase-like FMN-dependent dehydrogenase
VSAFDGSSVQNAIYVAGQAEWPIAPEDWEAAAEHALDPRAFGYIAGGAGGESTMRANLEAFERRRLRPRMLAGNIRRDLSVDVLGTAAPAPVWLAPVGVLSIAHAEAEVGAARGAAAAGVPFVLSSAASSSIEQVAEAVGDAPRWFQLYWISNREVAASFVRRAEAAGYGAIVVTLDTPILGWRPRDLRRAYLPFLGGEGCANFFTDPVFCAQLDRPPAEDPLTAAATMLATFPNLGLTWADLDWLREQVSVPLLVKGIVAAATTRCSRSSTASTGSSCRITAAARWTARSRRSTRSRRCERPSGLRIRCWWTAGSGVARTSSRRSLSARTPS